MWAGMYGVMMLGGESGRQLAFSDRTEPPNPQPPFPRSGKGEGGALPSACAISPNTQSVLDNAPLHRNGEGVGGEVLFPGPYDAMVPNWAMWRRR